MAINVPTWDERPELVRVMTLTRVGNAVRSVRRRRRLENLHTALEEITGHLAEAERRQAEGVFGCLINMLAWVTMNDENGMSGEEIAAALQGAMTTLIADLRGRNEAARNGNPQPPLWEIKDDAMSRENARLDAGSIIQQLTADQAIAAHA